VRGLRGGPTVVVPVGSQISVGRGTGNDLVLDDPRASGQHLRIGWRGAVAVAVDLGSTNGTWHNGHGVREARLADGDRLRVGRTVLVVDLPADPAAGPATLPDVGAAVG